MVTIKEVIQRILKAKSEALYAYYTEFRIIKENHQGYYEIKNFEEEYEFWKEEIDILNIESNIKYKLKEVLYFSLSNDNFFNVFETKVLPILLEHWTMSD